MALDDFDFSGEDIRLRLRVLFAAAKTRDEFEFACTLLRARGMEDVGWDPFREAHQLVEDTMSLVSAPLIAHTKVRLRLLLYSHLTEVGAMYEVLANLTRVVAGERYALDPFLDHRPRNRKGETQFLSTPTKVRALMEMLADVEQPAIVELLDWFFHASVRNAFAHADYTLHADKFRSRSEWFEIGGVSTTELHPDALGDLINRALDFYGAFMGEYEEQRHGYQANKVVLGRIVDGLDPQPIELIADAERGLYGFRSSPEGNSAPAE